MCGGVSDSSFTDPKKSSSENQKECLIGRKYSLNQKERVSGPAGPITLLANLLGMSQDTLDSSLWQRHLFFLSPSLTLAMPVAPQTFQRGMCSNSEYRGAQALSIWAPTWGSPVVLRPQGLRTATEGQSKRRNHLCPPSGLAIAKDGASTLYLP